MIKHKIEFLAVIIGSSITALLLYGLILYPLQVTGFYLIITLFIGTSGSFIYTLKITGFSFRELCFEDMPSTKGRNGGQE